MRSICIISVLLIFCLGCDQPLSKVKTNQDQSPKYVLSTDERLIKLVKEPNYLVTPKPGMLYAAVTLKLENKTNDTLKYINMSCSWDDIYTTNSKKVKILSWPCDKNYPTLYNVASHSSSSSTLIVFYKRSDSQQKFKIGITLHATGDDLLGMNTAKLFSNPNNLLWSNEITIP